MVREDGGIMNYELGRGAGNYELSIINYELGREGNRKKKS
ncbi:hypothetical protein N0824_03623 [Microcystis sp. 0824]|nr:hypothetical protein N0824_03623 [Microcystis sp. 0824]